jgi:hypothetical protein
MRADRVPHLLWTVVGGINLLGLAKRAPRVTAGGDRRRDRARYAQSPSKLRPNR